MVYCDVIGFLFFKMGNKNLTINKESRWNNLRNRWSTIKTNQQSIDNDVLIFSNLPYWCVRVGGGDFAVGGGEDVNVDVVGGGDVDGGDVDVADGCCRCCDGLNSSSTIPSYASAQQTNVDVVFSKIINENDNWYLIWRLQNERRISMLV